MAMHVNYIPGVGGRVGSRRCGHRHGR